RQNLACRLMLGLNQLGGEIRLVVVVNHGQRSHDRLVLLDRLFFQILANKVPYGLRPVLISPAVDGLVEPLEKLPFQGESSSNQITHCSPPETKPEKRNSKLETRKSHKTVPQSSGVDFRISSFEFRVSIFCPIYFRCSLNHSMVRLVTSRSCSGCEITWPSPGYTTSWVSTPRVFRACQNSKDWGAGHSPSRSPTRRSVGVLTFLMKVRGELLA